MNRHESLRINVLLQLNTQSSGTFEAGSARPREHGQGLREDSGNLPEERTETPAKAARQLQCAMTPAPANDTSVQPQPRRFRDHAMGAALRDPQRGSIPMRETRPLSPDRFP